MKKILFIINPFSGIGKQKTIENLIETKLDATKFLHTVIYTQSSGHAIEITKQNLKNFEIIVAVGGDGSINEVCQHIIGTDVVMGIIPAGSGNGFARHLQLPLLPEKAFEVINAYNVQKIDAAQCNERKFLNIIGIGFDADMGEKFATTKQRGFKGYRKIVIKGLKNFVPKIQKLSVDGKVFEREYFILSVANASQYGFNAKISPASSLTDGWLEINIIKKFPIAVVPVLAYRLFFGNIQKSKYVETFRGKEIILENKGEIAIHFDGEPQSLVSEIKINILPKGLNLIIPKHLNKF